MPKVVPWLLAIALLATATNVAAALCLPGTLQDYLALDAAGCDVGPTSFRNFELGEIPAAATSIDPATIQVTPAVASGAGLDYSGLLFTLNASAQAPSFLDALIRFNAFATPGIPLVGARAILGDPTATGDGGVTLIDEMCLDGLFAAGPIGCGGSAVATIVPFAVADLADPDLSTLFGPVNLLGVAADIGIDGGLSGAAGLAGATLLFAAAAASSPVPEPAALPLVALALALAVLARRRTLRLAR